MKRVIILVSISVVLFSCTKKLLEGQPEDALSVDQFYKNPDQRKLGLMGSYKMLQDIYNLSDLPLVVELMSDDGKDRFRTGVWQTFKKTVSDSKAGIWSNSYKMITNCNLILQKIDAYTPKDEDEKRQVRAYSGEARFLRALAYFNLVRIYGGVPEVVTPFADPDDAIGVGRRSVADIYKDIIVPDLISATADCYKKGDAGLSGEPARASMGAALTILADVYLTLHQPENAAKELKRLIVDKEAGDYALFPDFSKLFLPENKFNEESIFEVNFDVGSGQPSYWFRWMNNDVGLIYGVGTSTYLLVEHNLMHAFVDAHDTIRYATTIDSGYIAGSTIPIQASSIKRVPPLDELSKYNNTGTSYNYMVTRYADALLMYTEALLDMGQNGEAVKYINKVRERVQLPDLSASDLTLDTILHERRLELAFEGHRYFDLVRTGKAIDVISHALMTPLDYDDNIEITKPIPKYQLILPIPVVEIEKDQSLEQNPGY